MVIGLALFYLLPGAVFPIITYFLVSKLVLKTNFEQKEKDLKLYCFIFWGLHPVVFFNFFMISLERDNLGFLKSLLLFVANSFDKIGLTQILAGILPITFSASLLALPIFGIIKLYRLLKHEMNSLK